MVELVCASVLLEQDNHSNHGGTWQKPVLATCGRSLPTASTHSTLLDTHYNHSYEFSKNQWAQVHLEGT